MPGPARPFQPGTSGNPSGRPKMTPEMQKARDLARAASPEMVEALIAVVRETPDDKARIMAANSVLDRALGKPTQPIAGDEDAAPIQVQLGPVIFIPAEESDDAADPEGAAS